MGTMLNFKDYLEESVSSGSLKKVSTIIIRYLTKKIATPVFSIAGLEQFKNSNGAGYGIRLFMPKKKYDSIRFNWRSASGNMANLSSIDIWDGTTQGPKYHISFERDVSLVQVLPQLVDALKFGKIDNGSFDTLPSDVPLNESFDEDLALLIENVNLDDAFSGTLSAMSSPGFNKSKVFKLYKSTGIKILDAITERYPNVIQLQGRNYVWTGSDTDIKNIASNKNDILSSIGVVRGAVSKGSSTEKYSYDSAVDELAQNHEKLSYDKQLEDLEGLIKMTVAGASNALFVAGRGGIGKTHTVERVLGELGYSDGNGYFKNTGTASAAGIYSLLFKNQNEIVFFDDSDDALKDQEARNLFKAATDTKKIRKLVWNKMGKNVVEPDDYEDPAELIDQGLIPRYFNFTGKVIFISNLKMDKLDPDGALRTRAFMIEIDPTDVEVYDFMEKIVDKFPIGDGLSLDLSSRKKTVALLRTGKSKQTANLRKLSRALNMMAGSINAGVNVSDDELKRMIETYA